MMTIEEIWQKFRFQWVLIGDFETDENLNITKGEVLFSNPDREKVYKEMLKFKPKKFSLIFTGKAPEDITVLI